jgi:hypothetical protein
MADPANQFMTEIDKKLKKNGLDTAREGNNVTIKGVKKSEDTMTPGQKQSMQETQDANMQSKKDKAYNAAKTYPDNFAKGGMTASSRADGCAERGKTKGTIVMCGGGMTKK